MRDCLRNNDIYYYSPNGWIWHAIPCIGCKYVFLLVCTVSDLRVLLTELHPVRACWYNIGLELGISFTTLDWFQHTYSDSLDLMREMLKHWLKTSIDPPPTWEAVITALRSPIVNEKNIAAQLEIKYCGQVQCDAKESNSPTRQSHSPPPIAVKDPPVAEYEGIPFNY